MSEFLVTARKWRPNMFDEVVGQDHITTTLQNAIRNDRVAHAYIFTGPRGVGKTTTARILAKALNCLNPVDYEPCGECENCVDIQNNRLMDIIEIDGASNRGLDNIKNLRETVKYAPVKAKYKVYIIDEVHMLTPEAFNALLKTLEEPPSNTIFIFATTDIHKVPLTIISRCQRYDFRRIELEVIKKQLSKIAKAENINIDDVTLTLIAKKADGALRDAESFFDQVIAFCGTDINQATVSKMLNLIDDDIYFTISDAILAKSFQTTFEISKCLYDNGWNFIDFLDGLIDHFRNILTIVITNNSNFIESATIYKEKYLKYYGSFSEGDCIRILNFLNKSSQEIKFSQNQKIKMEIILTQLIGLEKSSTITELIENIDKINLKNFEIPENSIKEQSEEYKPILQKSIVNEPPKPKAKPIEVIIEPKQKWDEFVESFDVSNFSMLGSLVQKLRFISFEKDKIKLELFDSSLRGSIKIYKDELENKLSKAFGKKISIIVVDEVVKDKKSAIIQASESTEESNETENNDIENFIINKLGGKKVN